MRVEVNNKPVLSFRQILCFYVELGQCHLYLFTLKLEGFLPAGYLEHEHISQLLIILAYS